MAAPQVASRSAPPDTHRSNGPKTRLALVALVLAVGAGIASLCAATAWADRRAGWDQAEFQVEALGIHHELQQAPLGSWPRKLVGSVLRHCVLRPPLFTLAILGLLSAGLSDTSACILVAATFAIPCLGLALFAAARLTGLGRGWSVLTALAGMSMPVVLEFSMLATPDVLVTATVLFALTAAMAWFARPGHAAAAWVGLTAGAAALTKATAVAFVGPSIAVAVLLALALRRARPATVALHAAVAAAATALVAGLWYATHWRDVLAVVRWTAGGTNMEPSLVEDPWARIRLCAELVFPGAGYWTLALILVVPLVLRRTTRQDLERRGRGELLILLAGPTVVFGMMAFTRSEPRYYLPLLPPFCALAAHALAALGPRLRAAAVLLVALSCALQLLGIPRTFRRAEERLCVSPADRLDRELFGQLPLSGDRKHSAQFVAAYHDFNPSLLHLFATEHGLDVEGSMASLGPPTDRPAAPAADLPDFVIDVERRCDQGVYRVINLDAGARRRRLDLQSAPWEEAWALETAGGTRVRFLRNTTTTTGRGAASTSAGPWRGSAW